MLKYFKLNCGGEPLFLKMKSWWVEMGWVEMGVVVAKIEKKGNGCICHSFL